MHFLAFWLKRWGLLQCESWIRNPSSLDVNEWGQKHDFEAPVESSLGQHRHHKSVGTGQTKQLPFGQFCFSCRWAAPVNLPAHINIIYVKSSRGEVAQCLFFDYNYITFVVVYFAECGWNFVCFAVSPSGRKIMSPCLGDTSPFSPWFSSFLSSPQSHPL